MSTWWRLFHLAFRSKFCRSLINARYVFSSSNVASLRCLSPPSAFSKVTLSVEAKTSMTQKENWTARQNMWPWNSNFKWWPLIYTSQQHCFYSISTGRTSYVQARDAHCKGDQWEWDLSFFSPHIGLVRGGAVNPGMDTEKVTVLLQHTTKPIEVTIRNLFSARHTNEYLWNQFHLWPPGQLTNGVHS